MALNLFDPSNRMDNPPKPLSNQAEVYARDGTNFLAFNAAAPKQKVYEYQHAAAMGASSMGAAGMGAAGMRENLDVALRNRRVYGTGDSMAPQENQNGSASANADASVSPYGSVSRLSPKQLGPTGTGVGYGQEPLAPMAFTLKNVKPDLDDTLARRGVFAFKYRDIANPYAYADQYNFDLGGTDPFAYGRKTSVSESGSMPGSDMPSGNMPSGNMPSGGSAKEKQSGKRRPRQGFKESSLASADEMPLRARRQMMSGPERQNANPDAMLSKSARKNSAWRGGLQLGKPYNYDHNKYEPSAENQNASAAGAKKVTTSHHRKFLGENMGGSSAGAGLSGYFKDAQAHQRHDMDGAERQFAERQFAERQSGDASCGDSSIGSGDSQVAQPAGTPLMDSSRVLWPRRLTDGSASGGAKNENMKGYGDENLAKFVRQSRDYADRYNNIKPAKYTGKGAASAMEGMRGEPKYERPGERERMAGAPKSRTFTARDAGAYDPYAWEPGAGRGRRNSWREKDANHAYDTYGYQQRAEWIRTNGNPSEYSAMARNQFGVREQLQASKLRPRVGFDQSVSKGGRTENYTGVFQTDNMQCPEGQMMVNGKCIPAKAPGKPVCLPGWDFKDGKCRPAASV